MHSRHPAGDGPSRASFAGVGSPSRWRFLGGLAVLLGALVPLASIPMVIVLLTAIFTVHLPYGFSSIKLQAITAAGAQFGPPGYETDLLYLACLAALVLGGSGPLSIDRLLADRTSEAEATPNSTI
jgi:putative oxidoreductase